MKAAPQSDNAMGLLAAALGAQHDWAALDKVAQDRLNRIPNDSAAFRLMASCMDQQGQHEKARAILKPLIETGRATPQDMNQYAWGALFTSELKPEDVQIAQRGLAMQNNSFPIMHTLACLFAATGRTKEGRELLLQSMKISGLDEPNTSIWVGLGLIAEQYGEYEVARAAYARMEKGERESPTSSYALMQLRMKMTAELNKAGSAAGK